MPVTNYYTIDGQMIGYKDAGGRKDFLTDVLGSVTGEVDQTGTNRTFNGRYKPYGGLLWASGSSGTFGWVGTLGYKSTGLKNSSHYVRARHYSQTSGTWTTIDSFWPNELAYGYVSGRVLTNIDPTGLQGIPACIINNTNKDSFKPLPHHERQPCPNCNAHDVYLKNSLFYGNGTLMPGDAYAMCCKGGGCVPVVPIVPPRSSTFRKCVYVHEKTHCDQYKAGKSHCSGSPCGVLTAKNGKEKNAGECQAYAAELYCWATSPDKPCKKGNELDCKDIKLSCNSYFGRTRDNFKCPYDPILLSYCRSIYKLVRG